MALASVVVIPSCVNSDAAIGVTPDNPAFARLAEEKVALEVEGRAVAAIGAIPDDFRLLAGHDRVETGRLHAKVDKRFA